MFGQKLALKLAVNQREPLVKDGVGVLHTTCVFIALWGFGGTSHCNIVSGEEIQYVILRRRPMYIHTHYVYFSVHI